LSGENLDTRVAVCPGTYDPVTLGHVDVIERTAKIFDRVIVAVVREPRHKTVTFGIEDRVALLEDAVAHLGNVDVDPFSELVTTFAKRHRAGVIVKGLRAISDFEWEFQMNHLNQNLAADIETLYLMASAHHSFVSSSSVKEIAAFGGCVDDLVPVTVAERLGALFSNEGQQAEPPLPPG